MRVAAYHIPSKISGFEVETRSFGGVALELPVVTPTLLTDVTTYLEKARECIGKRKPQEIAEI